MSDKLHGGIKAGVSSVSFPVGPLRKTADSTEQTGLTAASTGLSVWYWRQGAAPTALSLTGLSAVDSAYLANGFVQAEGSGMRGMYRVDFPNAVVATGADWVNVMVQHPSIFGWDITIPLESQGAKEVYDLATGIKAKTDNLPSAVKKNTSQRILFYMALTSDGRSPATGLTGITKERSIDGGAFSTISDSITEIGQGWYTVTPAASHFNGDDLAFRFAHASAVGVNIWVRTIPA